jgi:hypothetical protein
MRFFLVRRDRETGTLALVAEEAFASREEARDALGDDALANALSGSWDLFMVDLDAASPVVVCAQPVDGAAGGAEEPAAGAWEAPAEPRLEEGADEASEADADTAGDTPSVLVSVEAGGLMAYVGDGAESAPASAPEEARTGDGGVARTGTDVGAEGSLDLAEALRRAASRM